MAKLDVCPDPGTLQFLLLGRLSADEAAALDEHVLACEPCGDLLRRLVESDSFASAARAAGERSSPADDRVLAAIAHWREVTLPAKAIEETLARRRDHTTDAWELEKLLDPPQAEGELGRFGGYRVLRVLGAGGMGLVLDAEDPQLRRRVALKVMQRSLAADEENRQRFLREARATAAIEHAHIVTVHQVGEHNGLPFLAMQLLKGESLHDRLERVQGSVGNALRGVPGAVEDGLPSPSSNESDGLGRPSSLLPLPTTMREETKRSLPLSEILRIGREIAEALAEAHARGLIHRDIKPANVWLEGASGWVKLVDFGLAHAAEDVHLTQTGAILGTPAYMSPEQARGETVDGRTDLYSLGAVLYKLTTGAVPFQGVSAMAVLIALATETPRPPIELNPDIPPALNDLIVRLLAKKPDDRHESAQAVAEAIRQIEASRVGIAHHRVADATQTDSAGATHSQGLGGQCPPYGRRPRWPLVAAAAAAAFLLATIVIIVRDKDGKELFRGTAPDGASVTLTEGNPAAKVAPALGDASDSSMPARRADAPPRSVEVALIEPPPLEEWLQGREALTVAQDGSGKFKTIQAALDALQPGQVVKVLDAGPYRERLEVDSLPADTGLVAEKGAVLELPTYVLHYKDAQHEYFKGHAFRDMDGFRLVGFTLAFPPRDKEFSSGLQTHRGGGFLLERCWIQGPVEVILGYHVGGSTKPIFVRECRIEGILHLGSVDNDRGAALVTQNLFSGAQGCATVGGNSSFRYVGVRGNVFANPIRGLEIHWPKQLPKLEINNNTFLGHNPILFVQSPPRGETVIYNNLRLRAGLAAFVSGAEKDRDRFLVNTRFAHNCYPKELDVSDGFSNEQLIPRPGRDVIGAPKLISKAVGDRDYLRPLADDKIATSGAGGDWPSYIGAFPPGPAPKEGDWFTRLQERWTGGQALPTIESKVGDAHPTLAEPPPLEEWLKGRTVLTVAQDGSGQFKTIQAALDALQPGQVVKVLGAGPYRKRLERADPPQDSGIVSEGGAVIELPDYAFDWTDEKGNDIYKGHRFTNLDGFHVAGFTFRFPPRTHKVSYGLWFNGSGGLVLERCWVRSPVQAIVGHAEGANARLACVRECRIDDAVAVGSYNEQAETLIARNLFAAEQDTAMGLGAMFKQLAIRGNLFAGRMPIQFYGTKKIDRLEISNNTFVDRRALWVPQELSGEMIYCNNLRLWPGFVVGGAQRDSSLGHWHFSHNAYPRNLNAADGIPVKELPPRGDGDVLGAPEFISKAMDDRNYLRPLADDPIAAAGAGGEWPTYIGAFPPGPAPKEGDWFTRLQERWTGEQASPTVESKVGNAHPTGEPPPLEEWLKGREVLTVAKDGSAKFKTIQAALDALQPGQVVNVLDAGPYRERLVLENVPRDTGLVTTANAVIELSEWKFAWKEETGDLHLGHVFSGADGFRLHGFELAFPKEIKFGRRLYASRTGGLVVEHCHFRVRATDPWDSEAVLLENRGDDGPAMSVHLRHCVIEGYFAITARGRGDATAVVENNLFTSGRVDHHLDVAGDAWKQVVVRENVFRGEAEYDVLIRGWESSSLLAVTNNTTTTTSELLTFVEAAPQGGVIVRNNLRSATRLLLLQKGAEANRDGAKIHWQIDHNAYPAAASPKPPAPVTEDNLLPRSSGDRSLTPRFLSKDPANADYLRIPIDNPAATGGAGGEWPTYIGALPPGPAPKEGDWFTRLQERWTTGGWASPTVESKVGNAHPTDEPKVGVARLKDAEKPFVVVGAGGASKAHKHLLAAIATLREGDVIEIHGNGPFHAPAVKLKSRGLTLRAAPGYRPVLKASGKFAQNQPWFSIENGPLTLEGCHFHGANESISFAGRGAPWHWRNCRFWSGTTFMASFADADGTIEDCLIRSVGHILCQGAANLTMTNSIVHTRYHPLHFEAKGKIVLTRNTFLGEGGVIGLGNRPWPSLTIEAEGNIFDLRLARSFLGGTLDRDDDLLNGLRQNIHFSGRDNVYCGPAGPLFAAHREEERVAGLAAWKKLWGTEETGSIEPPNLSFAWDRARLLPAAEGMAWVRAIVDDAKARQAEAPADLGPDWNLIGPGDAYLRALAAEGRPVLDKALRPEPLEEGPFVVLRAGQPAGAHASLPAALAAAQSGDVLEIRGDGPFDACEAPTFCETLTLRAAPGYSPVLEGVFGYFAGEMIVEGIHFSGEGVQLRDPERCRSLRLVNCSFDKPVWGHATELIANPGKNLTEMVNCWAPGIVRAFIHPTSTVSLRNSVIGKLLVQNELDGEARHARLERCVIWGPGIGHLSPIAHQAAALQGASAKTPTKISLDRTYVEASPLTLLGPVDFAWKNSRNLYRTDAPYLVERLRADGHSGDEGSLAAPPLDFDPRQWRLLPDSAGQGRGADVERIGRVEPVKAVESTSGAKVGNAQPTVGAKVGNAHPTGEAKVESARPTNRDATAGQTLARRSVAATLDDERAVAKWVVEQGGRAGTVDLLCTAPIREISLTNLGSIADESLERFQRCPRLMTLDLSGTAVTDQGLLLLSSIASLRRLQLRNTAVSDTGLKNLAGLERLEWLDLARTAVSDEELTDLAKSFPWLRFLSLDGDSISDMALPALAALTQLDQLDLSNTTVTDAGLARLKPLTGLCRLTLSDTQVTDAAIAALQKDLVDCWIVGADGQAHAPPERENSPDRTVAERWSKVGAYLVFSTDGANEVNLGAGNLPSGPFRVKGLIARVGVTEVGDADMALLGQLRQLRSAQFDRQQFTSRGLNCLKGLAKLEQLTIVGCPHAAGNALAALAALPRLRHLRVDHECGGAGLRHVLGLANLESLQLEQLALGEATFKQLTKLTQLQSLELSGTRVTGAGLARLAELPCLSALALGRNTNLTVADRPRLSELRGLESLTLAHFPVSADILRPLEKLPRLWHLYLENSHPDDAGFEAIGHLASLESLSVDNVTDAALAHIARLARVRLLHANGEAVTDAGLASLSRLPELRALSLGNMPHVTDAGLAHLQRLATLESLRLGGVPVGESGVAAFKAALPRCSVEFPLGVPWRK